MTEWRTVVTCSELVNDWREEAGIRPAVFLSRSVALLQLHWFLLRWNHPLLTLCLSCCYCSSSWPTSSLRCTEHPSATATTCIHGGVKPWVCAWGRSAVYRSSSGPLSPSARKQEHWKKSVSPLHHSESYCHSNRRAAADCQSWVCLWLSTASSIFFSFLFFFAF